MPRREYKGNAKPTILTSGLDNPTSTTATIDDPTGWPTGGANGKFWVTVNRDQSNEERILVQSRSGSTLTIASSADRGLDGTTAGSHTSGVATIEHTWAAVDADEANAHLNDPLQDHHTQYMRADGTRHDLTARHSAGTVVPTAAPVAITPDAVNAEGAGTALARATHVHGMPTATPVAIGTALSEGADANFARATHVHELGTGSIDQIAHFASGVISTDAPFSAAVQPWLVAAGDPGAVGANKFWFNTTKRTLLVRNAANTAWEVVMTLGPGVTYTPTLTGVSLGTGSRNYARKRRMGRQVIVDGYFKLGTGGNVTDRIGVGLPDNAANLASEYAGEFFFHGAARGSDAQAIKAYAAVGVVSVGTDLQDLTKMDFIATAGVFAWDEITPFNWDATDSMSYFIEYETADAIDTDFL